MNKLFHSLQVWEKMRPIDFKVLDNLEKDVKKIQLTLENL